MQWKLRRFAWPSREQLRRRCPHRPPALEGEELTEGGLGIAIIRTIADEFELNSQPGVRGSRLRFVKRLR